MKFFMLVCFFVVSFCCVKLMVYAVESYQYRKKEKQLAQLRQIYQYIRAYQTDQSEAEKLRTKDMKIEDGWLYTKNFYFDLYDDTALKRVEKYLLELMGFFLAYDYAQSKKNLQFMVEFKKELNLRLSA